jgi:cysteine dioxygenase
MLTDSLSTLLEYLDGLDERAPLDELAARLAKINICCEDMADFIRFSERGYMRNLVQAGEWYNVLVLCWKNGQRSPIHDHLGSSCAVKVLRGTATETLFERAPNGLIWATHSCERLPGAICASQDTDIHQVSNLQPDDADLVTLHIYSPPLLWMGTYSLTDRTRGTEPMFLEFCNAAGI